MGQIPIGLKLDEELLRAIDDARGDVPRARWIARACEHVLSFGDGGVGIVEELAVPASLDAAVGRARVKKEQGLCRQHGALLLPGQGRCARFDCRG